MEYKERKFNELVGSKSRLLKKSGQFAWSDREVRDFILSMEYIDDKVNQIDTVEEIFIKDLQDLPDPNNNIITLEENKVYVISGTLNLGINKLEIPNNVTLRGNSPAIDIITSDTNEALINSTNNFRLVELGFSATSGTIFDLDGSGSEICLCIAVRFFGNGGLGTVNAYDLFEINIGLFVGFTSGLNFTGGNGSLILVDTEFFQISGTPTSLDLGTATFNLVRLMGCSFTSVTGGTGIDIAPNSGNINDGFEGIMLGIAFFGAGTNISGYSALNQLWLVDNSNHNITPSDRITPVGWGNYGDGETSPTTQSLSTTFQKLQIDGSGSGSNTTYLPKFLRDTSGELWDSTNDKITPVSVGDSYNLRIDLEITAKGGGVSAIYLQLDIGGGATPSIIIVDRIIGIPKTAPFTVSLGFPVFSLSTFVANGGQIFVATDTGTATLAARNILIQRVSSGAI